MVNTEAFYRFHRFNEAFDRDLKITHGALEGLRTGIFPLVDGRTELPIGDEPWNKLTPVDDPAAAARSATRQTATMGIVRVCAALEDFLITLEADLQRTAFLRNEVQAADLSEPADGRAGVDLDKICRRLGLDPKPISFLIPLHDFFSVARNCIVHRNGRASVELESAARSEAVRDCLAAWPTRRRARAPELPEIIEGVETDWLPRHAILCVTVAYTAASLLNAAMIDRLGRKGLIYTAAHYALLADDPIDTGARKSAESVVMAQLQGRYRFHDVTVGELVETLKAMGKWDLCRARFSHHRARWAAKPPP